MVVFRIAVIGVWADETLDGTKQILYQKVKNFEIIEVA